MNSNLSYYKPVNMITPGSIILLTAIALWFASSAFSQALAGSSAAPGMRDVLRGHTEHIRVLRKIAGCVSKAKLLKAITTKDTQSAQTQQNQCISSEDRRILQQPPNTANMSEQGRNIILQGSNDDEPYYNSMSWGLGASAAAYLGGSVDGGFIWNIDGSGSTRFYGATATGKGVQLNLGADPVIINLYRDKVSAGKSKSTAIISSAEAGVSVTLGPIIQERPSRYLGFMFALGAGVGVNALSKYNITSSVAYVPCKNVTVKAHNRTGKDIKVVDVDFHHYATKTWHSKATWNEKVGKGKTYSKKMNLKKVGGEKMQIRVQYKIKNDGGIIKRYSSIVRDWSKSQECSDNNTINVYLKNMK